MTAITAFPSVPSKQRIASKLTAVLYQLAGADQVDLTILTVALTSDVATVTATLTADPTVGTAYPASTLMYLHGTGLDELDGLQLTAAEGTWATSVLTLTFDVVLDDVASYAPGDGGMCYYADFTPTSQITDFNSNVTASTDSWSTLGTEASEEAGETTRPITATAFLRDGMDQMGVVLGNSGDLTITKTGLSSQKVHFLSTNWDGRTATSKMQNYTSVVNCEWNDWGQGKTAGGWVEWSLTGAADEIFAKAVAQV